jgi:pimeloyl-ACP methyl ester carboxylesterase
VLREDRDIIVFDPRGTGASNRLSCDAPGRLFFGRLLPADHLAACRNRLASRADLSQYTSTATAHDLEAIRRALGYEALNVWGFSFGTRVAMAYAREYPNRVRALVLDGVVPFDVGLTADLAETLDRALETVLERCAHDAACHAAHGDVRAKVRALAARLDRAPAVARLASGNGEHPEVRVGRWELAYALRGMLYGDRAAAIPAVVHRAHSSGNLSEIAGLYAQRSAWPGDSTGLAPHLGAYCSEDLQFIRRAEVERRTRGTLMGPMYYEQYRSGCEAWPVPRATPRNREPLRAAVPTLLFSGERDPVTPPEYGARVLQYLPRATHVVTPGGGHAVQSPCKARVVAAFLAGPAATPDTGCLSLPGLPPFEIATPGDRSRS